jgi:hypothetical protein
MRAASAIVPLLVLAAPALADDKKTVKDVTFTCEVTGSSKDGFKIVAKNDGQTDRNCSASCTLTLANGTTKKWSYPSSGTTALHVSPAKIYFGGEASQPGAPFTNPTMTDASCN